MENLTETLKSPLSEMDGAFVESLMRNNNKIREDRAIQIAENTQLLFKRYIEDAELEIKKLKRDRENMLDLSPTTADSLVLASDFKAQDFVYRRIQIGFEIRNLEIKLELAKADYNHLFIKK